jgi:flagellar biosynthesis protein FlhG
MIISVASGKGGVGKSVLVGNLGLLLSKRGRRVVMADLDVGGANLHIMFGLTAPTLTLSDFLARRTDSLEAVACPVGGSDPLRLIPGTGDTLGTANMPYGTKQRLIRSLRALDADVILIDVGAGASYHALDFFLMADLHLVVATPDPTSVMDLYRFVKLAAIRRILTRAAGKHGLADTLLERDCRSMADVLDLIGDAAAKAEAAVLLRNFRPQLVLNRASVRNRINTMRLRKLLHEYVGGDLALLGEIPEDAAVERAVRGYLPVTDFAPDSPSARSLAAIADRLDAAIRAAVSACDQRPDSSSCLA